MQATGNKIHHDRESLVHGYTKDGAVLKCLYCDASFCKEIIYRDGDTLLTAGGMAALHVKREHGGALKATLSQGKSWTGLSEAQSAVLEQFAAGKDDSEAGRALQLSPSTIRNYRFQFRDRLREARIFMAVAELAGLEGGQGDRIVEPHPTATMMDERYQVTEDEEAAIIAEYFVAGPGSALKKFPRKEKRKIVVLKALASRFSKGARYSEKSVSETLAAAWPDYALLRRYLIEYGFMQREAGGGDYWLKEGGDMDGK